MASLRTIIITFFSTLSFILSYGQSQTFIDSSDEIKILKNIKQLNYIDKKVKILTIPKRKYTSPLFCGEIEKYKDGFIINSTTSYDHRADIDFDTKYFYYNLLDKSIRKINIVNADTIESIVSTGNAIFYSTIKNGKRVIGYLKDNLISVLNHQASSEISKHLDTAKWIKLGLEEGKLFVLSPNFLFQVSNNEWKLLTKYSIDDFYIKILKYKRSISMLPTKNIVIKNNFVYFLQEIVQGRSCNLFKLSIQSGRLQDFFQSLDYKDAYFKVINDFTFLSDNSLLVSASRLMDEQIIINVKDENVNIWSYNNFLTTTQNEKIVFPITTALSIADTLVFASYKGFYIKEANDIKPLIYFENTHQTIKEKKWRIDFNFKPRCIKKLSEKIYLVGGIYGGLYQVDVFNGTIICLDDINYDKLKSIDISSF